MALALVLGGCVSRKLFLRTDPTGARVLLDGRVVGTTPHEEVFLSYGTRSVVLELEGYETRSELLDLDSPWWQLTPLDLITDVLWPWTILDERVFVFALQPLRREDSHTFEEAEAAYERMRHRSEALGGEADGP